LKSYFVILFRASGFVTSAEIGPLSRRPDPNFGAPPPGYVPGIGRGAKPLESGVKPSAGPPQKEEDLSESNYDEFNGYQSSIKLFSSDTYDADDIEADEIYQKIDDKIESKRKRKREKEEEELENDNLRKNLKIAQLFVTERMVCIVIIKF
jgi:pre-mRNA-processing factor 6